jgi:hypothetical protein
MKRIELGIVGDDEDLELARPVIDQLMRFARRVDENLAGPGLMGLRAGANGGGAGLHEEEFPLREVGVERAHRRAHGNPADLQVKRMPAAPEAAVANPAQGDGNVAEERVKLAAGRADFLPRERRDVGQLHASDRTLRLRQVEPELRKEFRIQNPRN